ncbi:MAG: ASCH domain-containing protein [Burkholderiaceae bacterium]
MPIPANLQHFWGAFAFASGEPDDSRLLEAFFFGDSEALANELAGLVLQGIKRATAASVWVLQAEGKQPPKPGDLSIVTSWAGQPLCIIETEAVEIVPFSQVTAEFAAAEGEGDFSLSFWRTAHAEYFTRECSRFGRAFEQTMPVVCERFRVVYQPSAVQLKRWTAQGS